MRGIGQAGAVTAIQLGGSFANANLSEQPPRLDYLLLRKLTPEGEPVDNRAQTLRHLWPLLPRVSVVEYKSPGHPYRSGQLDRLWGYVHTYFANQRALPRHRADGAPLTPAEGGPEVREREDLCAVLVVAARTPSLDADVEAMDLTWENLGSGYLRVHDGLFTLYVVELDVAGPAEGDFGPPFGPPSAPGHFGQPPSRTDTETEAAPTRRTADQVVTERRPRPVSPPGMVGTRSTGSNGAQGPTRWHENSPSPPPRVRPAGGGGVVVTRRFS